MKALSIHPYFAMAITDGSQIVECRSWNTKYRGDIMICSIAKNVHAFYISNIHVYHFGKTNTSLSSSTTTSKKSRILL